MRDLSDTDGYCRVSTKGQATGKAGANALERYREDFLYLGIPESRIFFDIDSGGNDARENYTKVLERVKAGITKRIVIPNFERFTRSSKGWLESSAILLQFGVILEDTEGREIDYTTADGEFAALVKAAAAQQTRRKNQDAAIAGNKRRRRNLKAYSPPFGYLKENDKYVLNRNNYPPSPSITYHDLAKEVIHTFLSNGTMRGTVAILCQKYGSERYGKYWYEDFPRDRDKLKKWLQNPILRGQLAYFGNRGKKSEIVDSDNHEALLTDEEWMLISSKLEAKSRGISTSSAVKYPMSGRVRCACGAKTIIAGGRRRHYYCFDIYDPLGKKQCDLRGGMKATDAEMYAIKAICQRSTEIAKIIENARPTEKAEETPEIREKKLLRSQWEANGHPYLKQAIENLTKDIAELESQLRTETVDTIKRREILISVGSDPEFWAELPTEDKRFVFMELIDRLIISCGKPVSLIFKGDLGSVDF